ncbi:MAG: fructose-bisphosphatase class II [Chloroflexi bacterium]|nr:fructose-bisphosphatase class II [Chloroflexota bacterium]
MLARLAPQSTREKEEALAADLDIQRIYTCNDLIKTNEVFFAATGITDSVLLHPMQFLSTLCPNSLAAHPLGDGNAPVHPCGTWL